MIKRIRIDNRDTLNFVSQIEIRNNFIKEELKSSFSDLFVTQWELQREKD